MGSELTLQCTPQPLQKKSPRGTSTEGVFSWSQEKRRTSRRHAVGCTVIQMCWMAPGPSISASTAVLWPATLMEGETFQPRPNSRAATAPVPSMALPPFPLAPVGFSALSERVWAVDSRARLPRCRPRPSKGRPIEALLLLCPKARGAEGLQRQVGWLTAHVLGDDLARDGAQEHALGRVARGDGDTLPPRHGAEQGNAVGAGRAQAHPCLAERRVGQGRLHGLRRAQQPADARRREAVVEAGLLVGSA